MIDYLERLFANTAEETQAEEGTSSARMTVPEEAVRLPRAWEEQPEELASAARDEAYWQEETARRLNRALSGPEEPETMPAVRADWEEPAVSFREGADIRRDGAQSGESDLERRLRRESRRYDSGFFWY